MRNLIQASALAFALALAGCSQPPTLPPKAAVAATTDPRLTALKVARDICRKNATTLSDIGMAGAFTEEEMAPKYPLGFEGCPKILSTYEAAQSQIAAQGSVTEFTTEQAIVAKALAGIGTTQK